MSFFPGMFTKPSTGSWWVALIWFFVVLLVAGSVTAFCIARHVHGESPPRPELVSQAMSIGYRLGGLALLLVIGWFVARRWLD